MADDDGQDGPDLETLQAQIDMSMAFTHNIVSSWMKSSKAKLPSSSSRNDDRELEEYMRRPARLGVGASAPEATGVLSRETAKLRNKLTGKGKKRQREDEDESARPGAAKAGGGTADSDDEEDSRARVITKKARVDPFAAKGDGKKKKKKGDPMSVPAARRETVLSTTVPAAGKEGDVENGVAGQDTRGDKPPGDDTPLQPSSKKKKKKKHKTGAGQDGPTEDAQPGEVASRDGAAQSLVGENNIAGSKPPRPPSAPSQTAADPSQQSPHASRSGVGPSPSSAQSPPAASHVFAASPKAPATPTTRHDPFALPLLNLSGPPPESGDQQSGSPKKRRKRKKKKKKSALQPSAGTVAIPEDGDDDGSEDD
ncbi:hypothetical protein BV20DRAFT_1122988 [Pilatotrama ljubarskyi]|nr:hypothetical protein BV20DRAFT_1122988 [Pilatotrama ljubarskyi]